MAKYMPKPDAVMKNYGTPPGIYQRKFSDSMFSKKYSGILGQENTMICQKPFPITIDFFTKQS